ncbi:MAG: hypothetical protein KJZ62_09875 [Fimbriimonadaceae bacterium]|nr:hypothetical protein [Fimbriimonadaceae bacterium]
MPISLHEYQNYEHFRKPVSHRPRLPLGSALPYLPSIRLKDDGFQIPV